MKTTEMMLDKLDEMGIEYEVYENVVTDSLINETKDIIEIKLDSELTEDEVWEILDELEKVAGHVITSYNDGFETKTIKVNVVA